MKRTFLLCFILLGWLHSAFGQSTFNIDGFSEQYYGKVYFSDTTQTASAGWVEVYDRSTKKKLIHVDADELSFDLYDNPQKAYITKIPYEEQSAILYKDFNFDGVKDFAIIDGFRNWTLGHSFKIFLASSKRFVFSDSFTELTQDNQGMFTVNAINKTISTKSKIGDTWYQYSDYIVENNKPKLIRRHTDDYEHAPFYRETIEELKGNKMVKTTRSSLALERYHIEECFKFHVDKVNKDIILCNFYDDRLYYVILDAKQNVEFYYPFEELRQTSDFIFYRKNGKLTFKNKDASYTIYDKSGNIGVDITYKGKTHRWKGNAKSRRGSIGKLLRSSLDNVVYQ